MHWEVRKINTDLVEAVNPVVFGRMLIELYIFVESYDPDITIPLICRVLYLNAPSLSVNWLLFVTHFFAHEASAPPLCISSHVSNCAVVEGGGPVDP